MKDAAVDKKKVETKKKKDEEELAALEKEEAEKEDLRRAREVPTEGSRGSLHRDLLHSSVASDVRARVLLLRAILLSCSVLDAQPRVRFAWAGVLRSARALQTRVRVAVLAAGITRAAVSLALHSRHVLAVALQGARQHCFHRPRRRRQVHDRWPDSLPHGARPGGPPRALPPVVVSWLACRTSPFRRLPLSPSARRIRHLAPAQTHSQRPARSACCRCRPIPPQGAVDDRLIQKYEREAKEKNRESWYMAYIMDTNEEERAKARRVSSGDLLVSGRTPLVSRGDAALPEGAELRAQLGRLRRPSRRARLGSSSRVPSDRSRFSACTPLANAGQDCRGGQGALRDRQEAVHDPRRPRPQGAAARGLSASLGDAHVVPGRDTLWKQYCS